MAKLLASATIFILIAPATAFTSDLDGSHTINQNDWPQWRGPNSNGVVSDRPLPTRWNRSENIIWSTRLPGWGTSSPVVFGDQIIVTTEMVDKEQKHLLTLSLDRKTGHERWRHDFGPGTKQSAHKKSNLAVNTPAIAEGGIYVAFGNADIARYSLDGRLKWVNRYIPLFGDPKMSWGYSPSPVVLGDSILFPWDHHTGPCFLIGLNKQSGEIAWKLDRPIGTAHATPLLVQHHQQQDILVPGKNRLTAYDARTHRELWQFGEGEGPFNGEIIVSPVYGDGLIFLQLWRQSRIYAIRLKPDGNGPERVWESESPGGIEPSLLYYQGLLYVLMDNGVLICFDGSNGKEEYRERLGGDCNSSPIACNGHIYCSNNEGVTFVIKAGRKFELVASNELHERITASPAISGEDLVYRTDSQVFLIGRR